MKLVNPEGRKMNDLTNEANEYGCYCSANQGTYYGAYYASQHRPAGNCNCSCSYGNTNYSANYNNGAAYY